MKVNYARGETLQLGKQGENEAAVFYFPMASEYTSVSILHKRNGDTHPYAVNAAIKDSGVEWIVKAVDVASAGVGEAEVIYYKGDSIAKSVTYKTVTEASVEDGSTIIPADVSASMISKAIAARDTATAKAASASASAAEAKAEADSLKVYPYNYTNELQRDYIDVKSEATIKRHIYPWFETITNQDGTKTTRFFIKAATNTVCYMIPCNEGQVFRVRKPVADNASDGTNPNRFSVGFTSTEPAAGADCINGKVQTLHNEIIAEAGAGAKYFITYVYFPVLDKSKNLIITEAAVLNSVRIWRETIGRRSNTEFYGYYSDRESYSTFRDAMNGIAQRIGMANSYFYSASGLTRLSTTTIRDMAKLAIACASRPKVLDWCSTVEFTAKIHGINPREVEKKNIAIPNALLNSSGFPSLGGKGGSFGWSISADKKDWGKPYNAQVDTVATKFLNMIHYIEVCGRPCVLVFAVIDTNSCTESQSYYNPKKKKYGFGLYYDYGKKIAPEIAALLEYKLGGRTERPAMPYTDVIIREGGGYIAFPIPCIPALYNNAYTVDQMISRSEVVEHNADIKTLPASVSKLLTALVASDYVEYFHRRVMVRYTDLSGGSGNNYAEGDEFRFDDAMRVCLMESSNTLAHMIGREIGLAILHAQNNPPEYDSDVDDNEDYDSTGGED